MRRASVLTASSCVALLVAAWLSPHVIPYNMDEFVHYHALACATAPLQHGLPIFRDGCGLYDLRPPFLTSPWPLRSYLYIGSVPAVPFYPFWRLLDDPVSVRVQGAVFALVCLLLAARLLRVRLSSVAMAAVLLPVLLVTFLVDEGPVGLSAVLLLGTLAAWRRALAAAERPASLGWSVAAGLLLFLGIWVKLVFAWWLPAVAYFVWSEGRRREGHGSGSARRRARALAIAVVACALPTGLLLASVDRDGRPYVDTALRRGRIEGGPEGVRESATRLWSYVADASRVAPRNLVFPSWPVDGMPALLALAVVGAGLRLPRRREVVAWAVLAASTFGIASASPYSQWPHHFFFPLLLLVLALAVALDGLGPRARRGMAIAAALFWATLVVRWPAATFPTSSSFAKDEMLRTLRARGRDRETFQVHASWGTYYIAQLFGDPERIVVYLKGISDDPGLLAEVRALAAERGRPVLLVSSRRWDRLQTPAVARALGSPRRTWRFGDWWAVEYGTADPEASSPARVTAAATPPP
jgi:hypothetical protein